MNESMRSVATNLGEFKSIWEKERDERIQKQTKLLNYKNRLEVQKMHNKFEKNLNVDNVDAVRKRFHIMKMMNNANH